MSYFRSLFLGVFVVASLLVPQVSVADFFVIPVGTRNIKASDVYHLKATADTMATGNFQHIKQNGNIYSFTIPADKVFVITSMAVSLSSYPDSHRVAFSLNQLKGEISRYRQMFAFPDNDEKFYNFTPGIVIEPGSNLILQNHTTFVTITAYIYGYTTNP